MQKADLEKLDFDSFNSIHSKVTPAVCADFLTDSPTMGVSEWRIDSRANVDRDIRIFGILQFIKLVFNR